MKIPLEKRLLGFWVLLSLLASDVSGKDYYRYQRWRFEEKVQKTLDNLHSILNETKNIKKADDQDHTYEDKYLLVELTTHSTWDSLLEAFGLIGLNMTKPESGEGLSINLDAKTECSMVAEEEVDVKGEGVQETSALGIASVTRKVHTITQYKWVVTESYEMFACYGGGTSCASKKRKVLQGRSMSSTVVTTTKSKPSETCARVMPTATVELRWLLQHLNWEDGTFRFKIDRNAKDCKTPRRNTDVLNVINFHARLLSWLGRVEEYLLSIYVPPNYDSAVLSNEILNVEVDWSSNLPLFENSTVLSAQTVQRLREKEREALVDLFSKSSQLFPPSGAEVPVSTMEAFILLFVKQSAQLINTHEYCLDFVENMLANQLTAAAGKYLVDQDFREYMTFHNREFLKTSFSPNPFSVVVRHGDSAPVGSVSIEEHGGDGYEPAQLITRTISAKGQPPILVPIDASTNIEITGDRFLSGWTQYQFGSSGHNVNYRLAASARQFSSYILLLGTVTGPHSFQPKTAVLLKNKDQVLIPIITELLPSAKEFKDAIASLSPEQQRFARSFRAMQLESSVFGICIVQLKPQIEKLLNLPPDALAKEIELTETLTNLFVDYQIPSDLLSFDGNESMNTTEKVSVVKRYVKQVTSIVDSLKQKVIEEEKEKAKTRHYMAGDLHMASMPEEVVMMTASATGTRQARSSRRGPPTASPSGSPTTSPTASPASSHSTSSASTDGSSFDQSDPQRNAATEEAEDIGDEDTSSENIDFTKIPKLLDKKLEEYDLEGFLRAMIIKTQENWTRKRKANLLSDAETTNLDSASIRSEKLRSFDLLDAISKSGSLPIDSAELHIIVGVSHNFVSSLMETVYKDNINPIEKAEKTMLLFGSQIFDEDPRTLVQHPSELERLEASFPELMKG